MLKMTGFDDCIIGVFDRCGQEPLLCYDPEKVIEKLMDQGMDRDEAVDYFEFNQAGAWMGSGTPGFLYEEWENFLEEEDE